MTEDRSAGKRRRARRPTEATARLDRLRKRNADQLEAQREAERRVEAALKDYVDADVSISVVEQERDEEVSDLERQIEQVRETAQRKVEQVRAAQAAAVWQLNSAGRTVEQIADLLELSQKEARRLVSAGRTAAKPDHTGASDETTIPAAGAAAADRQQPIEQPPPTTPEVASLEQRDLGGIDSHQHSPNTLLVPAVPNRDSQRT